jgi:ribosome-associated protein
LKAKQKALILAEAIAEKKGEDLQILDLRELCSFTDFFVIATGTSARHLRTLADASIESSAKLGDKALGVEGQESARWILVDLDDVIVQLFREEAREFFGLERLWGEAEALELPRVAGAAR